MQCRFEGQALEVDRKVEARIGSGQKGETFKTDKQKDFKHFDNINCVTVTIKIQLFIKSWSTKSKIILPPPTFPRVKCSALKNVARGAEMLLLFKRENKTHVLLFIKNKSCANFR
jgi:hypothetical protein